MKRWLSRRAWPFVENIAGVPQGGRAYYAARMTATVVPGSTDRDGAENEPDFDALLA